MVPFGCGTNTAYRAVPLRGAIVSMGLGGCRGGLRGEIEIFPGPPAKKYKEACSAFCLFNSLRKFAYSEFPAPSTGSLLGGIICQDIQVNALVGTRSPYSLPLVILPVPARSPFRFIRHRRRSTPNLKEGAFWRALQLKHSHDGPPMCKVQ